MIDSLSQKHQKFRDFRPKFAEFSAILLEFCEFSRSWEPAGSGAGFLENYWILLIFIEICWNLLKFIGNYWNSLNFQWICNGIHWNSLESNRFYWKSIGFSIKKTLKTKVTGWGRWGPKWYAGETKSIGFPPNYCIKSLAAVGTHPIVAKHHSEYCKTLFWSGLGSLAHLGYRLYHSLSGFHRISWIFEVLGAGGRSQSGNLWNSLIFYWNLLNFQWISNGFPMKSIGIHKNPIDFIENLLNLLLKTNKKQRSRAGDPGDPPLFATFRELEHRPKRIFLSKGELRGRIEANSWCYEIVW